MSSEEKLSTNDNDPAVEEGSASEATDPSVSSDSVRVAVRVRPLNAREKASDVESKVSWDINSSSITQCIDERPVPANSFAFDNVFQQNSTNTEIFSNVARPVVKSAVDGVNGVIFAYGQTAAGKTYTMLGTEDDPGVTKRSISAVFNQVLSSKGRQYLLRASYIEIYNEIIRDLLSPGSDNLKIHEDVVTKRVFVDSREEVVTSVQDVMSIIAAGEHARAVGVTNMNDRSSRSHTIFSLKIESREISSADPEQDGLSMKNNGVAVCVSTLSLVDLAGSERASFTKAQGMRLVEGGHINKSLLTLGTVINKLSSGEKSSHIPYRDSKLTRILQPALGGNARTAIICAVTPAILHMDETLSTLKFASRAKKVTNHASTNEYLDDRAKLRRAEKEVTRLKKEIQRLSTEAANQPPAERSSSPKRKECPVSTSERISRFEKKFKLLVTALDKNGLHQNHGKKKVSKPISLEECRLRYALDLASQPIVESADVGSSQVEADLRRQLFDIEKERHRLNSEIKYERLAMNAEVSALVTSNEAAEQSRMAAERECDEAMEVLAEATAASLVDEIIGQSVTASYVSKELRKAEETFKEMQEVKQKNESLMKQSAEVSKKNMEMTKREKRGVGPVLKELSLLKTKFAECENKLRTTRQTSSKMNTEKIALERDLKEKDRKIKVLTGELDRHRNHISLGQARVAKEAAEEKKKFETALGKVEDDVKRLENELQNVKADLKAKEVEVAQHTEKVSALTAEKEKLEDDQKMVTAELEKIRASLEKTTQESEERSADLQKAKDNESCTAEKLAKKSEELSQTLVIAQETKYELLEAVKGREELEKSHAKEMGEVREEMELESGNHTLTKTRLEEAFEEKDRITAKLEEIQCKLDRTEKEGKELSKCLQEAKNKESSTVEKLSKMSEELSEALVIVEGTKSDLSDAMKEKAEQEKDHENEMQAAREKLEEEIQKHLLVKSELEECLKEHQESAERLQCDASKQIEQMKVLEESLKEANTGKAEALAACDNLEKKHFTLEEEVAEMKNDAIEAAARGCRECIETGSELAAVSEKFETLKAAHESSSESKSLSIRDLEKKYGTLKKENEDLLNRLEAVLTEGKSSAKDMVRLSAIIQTRDKRIYGLEDKLVQYSRGEGAIARLNGRIQRRDTVITNLTRRIDVLQELVEKGELSSQFFEVDRICSIEGNNESLRKAKKQLEEANIQLEKEKAALINESRKLRDMLKMKDVQRLKDNVQRKEQLYAELTCGSENVQRN